MRISACRGRHRAGRGRGSAPPTGTTGTSRCFHWPSSRSLRASRSAPQIDQRELRQLRGLDAERAAEVEPVPVAVDLGARERRRAPASAIDVAQAQVGHHPPGPHRQPRGAPHQRQPDRDQHRLLADDRHTTSREAYATTLEAEKTMTRPSDQQQGRRRAAVVRRRRAVQQRDGGGSVAPGLLGGLRSRPGRADLGSGRTSSRGRPCAGEPARRGSEGVAALGVVAEHVHRRAGRRQQHGVARAGEAAAARTTSSIAPVSVATTSTTGISGACRASASAISARSWPIRTAPRSRSTDPATSSSNAAALGQPAGHPDDVREGCSDAAAACGLVALESSTYATPSTVATCAMRWAPGSTARSPARTASGGTRSRPAWSRLRASAAAASALATLCGAGGRTSSTAASTTPGWCVSPPLVALLAVPLSGLGLLAVPLSGLQGDSSRFRRRHDAELAGAGLAEGEADGLAAGAARAAEPLGRRCARPRARRRQGRRR